MKSSSLTPSLETFWNLNEMMPLRSYPPGRVVYQVPKRVPG
jgi:hypothetical protein